MVWIDVDLEDEGVRNLTSKFSGERYKLETSNGQIYLSHNGISIMAYDKRTIVFFKSSLDQLPKNVIAELKAILQEQGLEKIVKGVSL